ncbi:hypothetical protein LJB42_001573 [Komagataella kurtzmanii]|nr:hypothetical protein LJB42_001573 [Komagataella kurtzmanii]
MKLLSLASIAATTALAKAKAVPYANPIAFAEALAALSHGAEYAQTMGEIAMMFPPDREWSEDTENEPPCGTSAGVGNRTDFPLDDGFVALVAQSSSAWSVELKISYNENPTSNGDFDTWATGNVTNQIDIGHSCFYLPDQPSDKVTGDVATIQLLYMALEEDDRNVTHYACSDIQFVEESVFMATSYARTCFNITDNDYYSYSIYAPDDEESAAVESTAESSSSTNAAAQGMIGVSVGILGSAALLAASLL